MNFPKYFLALCLDRPSDPDGFVYTLYFVNNSNKPIDKLTSTTGGFATFDDDLVHLEPGTKMFESIPSKSAIVIEHDDEGSFDFVIYFNMQIEHAKFKHEISFDIPKYLRNVKQTNGIPIIGKSGMVFFPR